MERKYSVAEIDRMREAVVGMLVVGVPSVDNLGVVTYAQRYASSADVEDRLRTYMLAGIEPEELERAREDRTAETE